MRRGRWAFAAAAAVALVVVAPQPASAHAPDIAIDQDPWPTSVTTQPSISGAANHAVSTATGFAGVDHVEVKWERQAPPEPIAGCSDFNAELQKPGENSATVPFSHAPNLPCNGRYRVTVSARSRQIDFFHGSGTQTVTRPDSGWMTVAVPPAQVTDLKATASSSGRAVKLEWNESPEPDRVGYLIDRRVGSGSYVEGYAVSSSPSFTDDNLPSAGGKVSYRVWAVRLGSAQDIDDASDYVQSAQPSTAASATAQPAPTGDGGDGGDGGDDGGGSGGGSGTGSGSGGGLTIATTPTDDGPGPRADLSGFAALRREVDEERRLRSTTTDPGYEDTLPYGEGGRDAESEQAGGPRDRSTFEDVVDRKAVLAPIAAGLLLFVGALQLRYLSRRARSEV